MKVKFQADADFNQIIVRAVWRQEPAIDFQTAHEAGLRGLSDPEVRAYAACEGRLLVSHDLATMPSHFSQFVMSEATSTGLLILRQQLSILQALNEILKIWRKDDASQGVNQIQIV